LQNEKMFAKVILIGALCVFGASAQENFKDCLEKDSISCVQLAVRIISCFFFK